MQQMCREQANLDYIRDINQLKLQPIYSYERMY